MSRLLLNFCGGSMVYSDGTPLIWHITLMMVPLGSATKNLRTPHGSFVSGYTILSPRETAREWTSSTSETSILIWGRIVDESSPIRVTCAVEILGGIKVTIEPLPIASSKLRTST